MASEYLKWKYRDVKPREKIELTPAEKRKNWWHYHKWHVVLGVVVLLIALDVGANALGIGKIKPDYQVAYIGTNALPDDTAAAIEAGFAALGEDLNGDRRVVVTLVQYASGGDAEVAYAMEVQLMSDILEGESYFFLLEDPEKFQLNYHSLCRLDGSLPEVGDEAVDDVCLGWTECPVLAGMELGSYSYSVLGETVSGESRDVVAPLFVARRGFLTEKSAAHQEGCAALWDRLMEGAVT